MKILYSIIGISGTACSYFSSVRCLTLMDDALSGEVNLFLGVAGIVFASLAGWMGATYWSLIHDEG